MLERLNYQELSAINNRELAEAMPEHLAYYRENRGYLIEQARLVRVRAESHRGFHVGCAVLAVKKEAGKRESFFAYDAYCAPNYTPIKKDPPASGFNKRCAERNGFQSASNDNVKLIVAVITISEFTSTGDPSKGDNVLHPCKDCRDMMRDFLVVGILREDAVLCHVNDKNGMTIQEKTVKQLLDMYPDDNQKDT